MSTLRSFVVCAHAVLVCGGCTALQTKEERTWLALHAIDSVQTYRISQSPKCYHEANWMTSGLIGEHPSGSEVIGWSLTMAALHVAVSDYLLRNEHPRLAKAWQYFTIGSSAYAIGSNYSIGIRIGGANKPERQWCD